MRKLKILFILCTIVLLIASFFYIYFLWGYTINKQEQNAIQIAEMSAIGLDGEAIKGLSANFEDQSTIPYISIKRRLDNFSATDPSISFVYLYTKKGDALYFMVDSEPIDSEDYSPPGQAYAEAGQQYYEPFQTKESLVTKPSKDRWGTWVSILAPIIDENSGEVIAVLGIDYPAQYWKSSIMLSTLRSGVIVVPEFFLLLLIYLILRKGIINKESRDRIEMLSRQSKTFIWEVDSKARYTHVSDNVEEITGYSRYEIVHKKTVMDLHPEQGREEFSEEVFRVLKNKEKITGLDNPILRKDGKVVWVLSAGVPILDRKGNLYRFRGSDTDISGIKETEAKLEKSKKRYQSLVSNIPGVIFRCSFDKDWTMEYIDKDIKELSGYPMTDFINNKVRTYNSIIHPQDRKYVQEQIKDAISRKKHWNIEYRIVCKNKTIKWVLERGRSEKVVDRSAIILDGIIMDITDRKKTETDLMMSRQDLEIFKLAVDNASDHIVITDPDGVCIYANTAVTRITGFSKQEIIDKKVGTKDNWGGFMPKNTYEKLWETLKVKKKPFVGEFKNRKKNGEEYYALASISPVFDEKEEIKFFIGIERDITHEKEIDNAKTEFVSLASHQLRTPLSTINWYAEMILAGDAGRVTKAQKEYMQEIYAGNQRMVQLVNALLDVSRLELGTFTVDPEIVDVKQITRDIVKNISIKAKEKHQELEEKYKGTIPRIKADPKLLHIVIENLLSNAVKYTPEKGRINLEISTVKRGGRVDNKKISKDSIIIKVADNGYGISANQHNKVFNKLFRADNIIHIDTEGTGLGLYIVKSILDHSGGSIWFASEEDKGTTFYVTIPISGMKKKKGSKSLNN